MELNKAIKADYTKVKNRYGLSKKQYEFCNAYITSGNAANSARIAGYAGDTKQLSKVGYNLLQHKGINRYIEDIRVKNESDIGNINNPTTKIGMDYIITKYLDLINNCNNPNVVRAALSDLTKIKGGYAATKVDISSNQSISIEMEQARKRLTDI